MSYSDETIALVALLHDVCKINVYKKVQETKKIDGQWRQVDVFEFEDDIPFGHGEKKCIHDSTIYAHNTRRSVCDSLSYGIFWK